MDQFQTTLYEFIRRLGLDDDRLELLERRATALSEGIRNLWTDGLSSSNACLTTISGKVIGCDAAQAPLASSQLRVVGHTTGTAYGTFSVTSGTFALALVLNPADTSLDLYATGPGVRFAESPARIRAITQCTTNAVAAVAAAPATGYHCTSEFVYPLADTLTLVDSVYGTRACTYVGPNWLTATINEVTLGSGTCPSATTPLTFLVQNASSLQVSPFWKSVTSVSCPNLAGPSTGSGGVLILSSGTGTLPGVSAKMDLTVTWPAVGSPSTHIYGGATATTRVYEP